jgi:hypothetical protein
LPRVRSAQIAHTGCLVGTRRALYNDGTYVDEDIPTVSTAPCRMWVTTGQGFASKLQMTHVARAKWRIPRDRTEKAKVMIAVEERGRAPGRVRLRRTENVPIETLQGPVPT